MNIVVSGASRGIGRAIALKFASKAFNVAVCSRNEEKLKEIEKELKDVNPNGNHLIVQADMSNKNDVIEFAQIIKSQFNTIEVLVNNAGVFLPGKMLEESDGVFEKMIETNLYGAYYLTRALIKNMIDKNNGHIINICSVASLKAYPNGGTYTVSKFALLGFSKSLREELKENNIRVTSVMPGATITDSWEGVNLPNSRFMPPKDIAQSIWDIYKLSDRTVVEDIILRPQLGDI